MKKPRNIDASELIKALRILGYEITRQPGSPIRITTDRNGQLHEVIPNHSPIKVGTLSGILRNVSAHHAISPAELLSRLDL